MLLYHRIFLCLFVVGAGFIGSVGGQTVVDSTDRQIGELVVKAYLNRFLISSPTSAQVLSGKDLEKLNSLSVADAVRYFSGVQLKDYGGVGGLKTINVRSMGSAHTAVFYDGMSVGNAQNGEVDLGKYSLDNIEAIELYNGQKSSIFQPARGFFSSNTLYLRSQTPKFKESKNQNFKVSFKTGSFGLVSPSVVYQQKVTPKIYMSTNLQWVDAHGRYKYRYHKDGGYDTTAVRQNGDVSALKFEIALHSPVGRDGKAMLKAYLYDSQRGLPGVIVSNVYKHGQRLWDRNFFVHGSVQKAVTQRYEMMVNLKFARDATRYLDPDYIKLSGPLDNHYYQNELYASLVNQYSVRQWWSVSLSTDLAVNTLESDIDHAQSPTRQTYLEALSSQWHWKRVDVQANLLWSSVFEQVKKGLKPANSSVFCPVVSLSFQPLNIESFRIRAMYKESFRVPTFNDRHYTLMGSSSLRPEFTTQYNIGTTWIIEPRKFVRSLSIQGDLYHNRVKDKIVAIPATNLFRWTMTNLGLVEIRGAQLNTNIALSLPQAVVLEIGLGYTFQQAIDITPNSVVFGDQIPYTPRHSGTVTSSVEWRRWQLNYSFIYTGERFRQSQNSPENYVQPWYTSDMAVVWQGSLWGVATRVGGEVNNLMNQYYDVVVNYPMPGRNYKLNLSINF